MDWKYLTTVADGCELEINGINVWSQEWIRTKADPIEVLHPNYPDQKHKVYSYIVEIGTKKISFAAGELSNCVWCFYVPS